MQRSSTWRPVSWNPAAWTGPLLAPFGLPVVALVVGALVVADVPPPIRALPVLVFVMAVPGWALLACWDLATGWLGFGLAVATSASLATAVATTQLYLGLWSPTATVLVLVLATWCAGIGRSVRLRREGAAS